MYMGEKKENQRHGSKSFTQINKWHEKKLVCLKLGSSIFYHLFLQFSYKMDTNLNVLSENIIFHSTSLGCFLYTGLVSKQID